MRKYNCDLIGNVVSVEETPDFVNFYLSVSRVEGGEDILPIMIGRENLKEQNIELNKTLQILGIVRTIRIGNSQRSLLRVEAVDIKELPDDTEHKNRVFGRFYVKCSRPRRKTTQGYTVKDITFKRILQEGNGVSEFRGILWNKNAEEFDDVENNSELYIVGRLQSREYVKNIESERKRVKTYEVSIGMVENDTDFYAEDVIEENTKTS